MKAIILARVSDKKQDSNEAQVVRISDYIKFKNLTIWKTIEIEESSTKGDREKFQEVIQIIKEMKECIALVVDTVDRLQRSFKESVQLDELRKAGKIEIHFYRENLVVHKDSNSADLLRWDMAVMFARSYVLQLSDNVKRKIEQKIRNGEWIGKAPFGYKNDTDEKEKKNIIPDPIRSHFVIRIFQLYSEGNNSIRMIANEMEKLEAKSNTKNPKLLSSSQIYAILKNPFYYGIMRIKGELYQHNYEPLISKFLFDKCQVVMNGYHKKPFKYAGKPYILRGLFKCAECGCMITPEITKGHIYYSCTNHKKFHGKRLYIPENDLLEPLLEVFKGIQLSDDKIALITEDLKKTHESKNDFREIAVSELKREHDKIEKMISNLFDLRLQNDPSITSDIFSNKHKELREKQVDILEKIKQHDNADEKFYIVANTTLILAKRALEIFNNSEITKKRALLNFVFQNLELKGRKPVFMLKKPFDEMLAFGKCPVMLRRQDSNLQPPR